MTKNKLQRKCCSKNVIQKNTVPDAICIENSALSAPPGARTLDTLIKSNKNFLYLELKKCICYNSRRWKC